MAQRCWKFLVIEADQPRFEKHITGLAAGSSGACELRLHHKNGGVVWVASFAKIVQEPEHPELLSLYGGLVDITARKQAEAALRESEATLRTLIESNPESLFLLDTRGVVLAASKVAAQRIGKSLEEIIGADAFALVPPEVGRKRFEIFQQVVATAQARRFEDVRGDFHLDISMNPIFDQGKVVQVAVLAVDITARKQADEALRESEQRFRDITEYAAEWVWEVDPQGKYTYSSPVVEQLLGYKPEEILGKYFYDFFLPDQREELKNAALAAFAAKQPFQDFFNSNLHKDGRTVQLSTSGIPILDEQGNLLGYRGADIDITARKQAEAELRQSEQRFRLMAETIQDVFWISTPEIDNMIYVSPAYELVFGRLVAELYQFPQAFLESIHPEDREQAKSEIFANQRHGLSFSQEYRIIRTDGAVRWLHEPGLPGPG